jgi:hypothetical protein
MGEKRRKKPLSRFDLIHKNKISNNINLLSKLHRDFHGKKKLPNPDFEKPREKPQPTST